MNLRSTTLAFILSALSLAPALASGQELCQAAVISNLEACIRKNPTDLQMRKQYVLELVKVGKARQASAEMDGLIRAGLRNSDDFRLLADCCRFSGEQSKAIRYYQESLSLNAADSHASAGMALSYLLAGQSQIALKVCKDALPHSVETQGRRDLLNAMSKINEFQRERTIAKQPNKADGVSF